MIYCKINKELGIFVMVNDPVKYCKINKELDTFLTNDTAEQTKEPGTFLIINGPVK
jgi:hypothetical protein